MVPTPTYIYHITALENLPSICGAGGILCKRSLDGARAKYQSIAYDNLQDRRSRRIVRGRETLHDFVPFTFAPRSPMLKAIHSGHVTGYRGGQDGVAHVVSTAQRIRDANLDFVFTDYHAVVAYAKFYDDLGDLDKINWELFFEQPTLGGYCKWWHSKASPAKYINEARPAKQSYWFVINSHIV